MQRNVLYSFESYLIDVNERRLSRAGEPVPLTPKAFETLVVLLENKGRIVEKDYLLNRIWAGTFVEESTLAQNIWTIRKTLGTFKNGKSFIETVQGRGYRFVADISEVNNDEDPTTEKPELQSTVEIKPQLFSDDPITLESATGKKQSILCTFYSILSGKKHLVLISTTFLVLAGIIVLLYYILNPVKMSSTKFRDTQVTKLTSTGNIQRAAISPDGKYLVMVEQHGETQSVLVRQIDNSSTVEILPPKKRLIKGLTFAPNGKQVYYVSDEKVELVNSEVSRHLYRIAMLGGAPQQIARNVDSPITISPDERQFAFVRVNQEKFESAVIVSTFDDSEPEKIIAVRPLRELFSTAGLSWSPDGKTIVCVVRVQGQADRQMDILTIDLVSGEQNLLSEEKWLWVGQPAWLRDGSGAIFPALSARTDSQKNSIWLISFPEGKVRQIAADIDSSLGLSLTGDSASIITIKTDRVANFWIASAPDFQSAKRISQSLTESNCTAPGINWMTNNKILYGSTLNGNLDIWAMEADGGGRRQITTAQGADIAPFTTYDGRFVVFVSNRNGKQNLWRMKPDGSEQTQLTNEDDVSSPSITPDNRTVFYSSFEKNSPMVLRKVGSEGGESKQLTSHSTFFPQVSPDGKFIACYFSDAAVKAGIVENLKLTILSAETGEIIKQFDKTLDRNNLFPIAWSNNNTITYLTVENGSSNLWEHTLEQSTPQLLLSSPNDTIFRFAWSPDGQKLVYQKCAKINDIVLIGSAEK